MATATLPFIREINKETRILQKILEKRKGDAEILECARRKDALQIQLNDVTNTQLISNTVEDATVLEASMGYRHPMRSDSLKSKEAFARRALVRSLTMDLARLEQTTRLSTIVIGVVISGASSVAGVISYLVKCTIRLIFSDSWRFILKVILTGKID